MCFGQRLLVRVNAKPKVTGPLIGNRRRGSNASCQIAGRNDCRMDSPIAATKKDQSIGEL